MIRLADNLPSFSDNSVELFKEKFTYKSYPKNTLFWVQDNDRCFISMLDGDMVIKNNGADIEELSEFLSVIAPKSIFSDSATLKALGKPFNKAYLMKYEFKEFSDEPCFEHLKSDDVYAIFKKVGFRLPDFKNFAVDYCHRINHGLAECMGIKDICAAVVYIDGNTVLINGIASLYKGYGTKLLGSIVKKYEGFRILAVCEESVKNFYIKNGFFFEYEVGYRVD